MKNSVLRLTLFVPLCLLAAGCATNLADRTSAAATEVAVGAVLGRVGTSGAGLMPSYGALRLALLHEAARQFNLPEDQIVLGPVETEGARTVEAHPQEQTSGGVTVSLPPGNGHEGASWSASAEVRRKAPAAP